MAKLTCGMRNFQLMPDKARSQIWPQDWHGVGCTWPIKDDTFCVRLSLKIARGRAALYRRCEVHIFQGSRHSQLVIQQHVVLVVLFWQSSHNAPVCFRRQDTLLSSRRNHRLLTILVQITPDRPMRPSEVFLDEIFLSVIICFSCLGIADIDKFEFFLNTFSGPMRIGTRSWIP